MAWYRPELVQHLSLNGLGTGTYDFGGADYEGIPTPAFIQPRQGEIFWLERCIPFIQDGGTWAAEKFGSITALDAGLGSALRFRLVDVDSNVHYLDGGVGVANNAEWGSLCFDVDLKSWGSGDSFLPSRWTHTKDHGAPIQLDGDRGERLEMVMASSFNGITSFRVLFKGKRRRVHPVRTGDGLLSVPWVPV